MITTPVAEQVTTKNNGFQRAKDARGHKVPGIWARNGLFYAQMTILGKRGPRRVPLTDEQDQPVATLPQAVKARYKLLSKREKGESPGPKITPVFSAYIIHYLDWLTNTKAKSPLTIKKERGSLNGWAKFLGETRLNQITRSLINKYVAQRTDEKNEDHVSTRAANLDVIALGNMLRFAKDEGWVKSPLVTDNWTQLKYTAPKRSLLSPEGLDKICTEAVALKDDKKPKYENGQFLADLLRFLAYSGARRQAALSAKWDQVDWGNRQVTLFTKYDKTSVVDFNDKLEAHLKDMHARRDQTQDWIFPSPRKQKKGQGFLNNPQKVLYAVTEAAGFPDFKLHDLRHFFISFAVMSGVDTLTIATWVSHSDGGKLIGSTYGHLDPKHKRDSAAKIRFSVAGAPQALPSLPASTAQTVENLSAAELLELLQKKLAGQPEKSVSPVPANGSQTQKSESAPRPGVPSGIPPQATAAPLETSTVVE